ncbi:lipid-A-disaccharide synthase N-terminal domain-containing protein [Christiangramia forsetii]|uniref:Membrane protein containing the N-terminal domain of lipid-A-disaccharide synthase n=2 Tax=Christiangramia forsetii TaxID=411153 RepID=A0M7G4_CHRFK|nr:lipid-A-disaccharide synthase N-terminal domain-containing protein [Christiangramia forsetii]GGG27966.1 lauroyl acyltransferase [Christiangramia forsetii]CAL68559.1 membrane protein containing the N-terminal domain of lipid-A-disaccharide synthase [Christiangramia forsetii KT0803]
MENWPIFTIGFLAQLLFSARLISQWFLSEKSQKVETPVLFWKLSLLASILLFIYGYLREDLAIMLGQFLIYGIYWRNLNLQGEWHNRNIFFKSLVIVFPIGITAYILFLGSLQWSDLYKSENITALLIALGIIGQIVYTSRFFYQWYHSEKTQESSLPMGFWVLSLIGSILLFTYGIFRDDPVLVAAHFFGGIIYVRDMYLLKKSGERTESIES